MFQHYALSSCALTGALLTELGAADGPLCMRLANELRPWNGTLRCWESQVSETGLEQ